MPAAQRTTGASIASRGTRVRLRAWLAHHRRVAVESVVDLLRNWLSSIMTWLVIGIALALPAILYLILANVSSISETWEGQPRLSLYLAGSLSDEAGKRLAAEIGTREEVASTRYIS